jgi:hypothetical protein
MPSPVKTDDTLRRFLRIKEAAEDAAASHERAKGALGQVLAAVEKELGAKDLEGAEAVARKRAKEAARLEVEFEKAVGAFEKEFKSSLEGLR